MSNKKNDNDSDIENFPNFELPAIENTREFTLTHNHLMEKTFILYTYPKDSTSGCTKEANDFSSNLNFFKEKGLTIYGISKDSIKSHKKFIEKEKIPFPLISDPDCILIKSLGCWIKKSMYGKEYMGISRSTFLVEPNLVVKKIWRNVKVKNHVEDVMKMIDFGQ